jgi:pimeloyl-ACP methyl ester carboxylesterase
MSPCIRLPIVFALLLLAGCAHVQRPDLHRLYASNRSVSDQPPVILVPGLMGSRIADADGRELWPGSFGRVLFSSYPELALQIDPATLQVDPRGQRAVGITDQIAGRAFYASIIETLRDAGGFELATLGRKPDPGKRYLYVLAYDWRLDNIEAARALDRLIEQIRIDFGQPTLKVDIVAHSMGGLIARYYLRYGSEDVLERNDFPLSYRGAGRVRRVALLGTPNLGSVGSLHSFIAGRRVVLGRVKTEHLATFPSLFELFPHPINDWIIADSGLALDRDVFDVELWRRFQWSVFDPKVQARIRAQAGAAAAGDAQVALLQRFFAYRLERARRFVWSLTVPLADVPWDMVTFGGDCTLTPARILVENVDGDSLVRLWPDQIKRPRANVDYDRLMLEPGDSTVTKASLLARESLDPLVPRHKYSFFPVRGSFFLCERHDALSSNSTFQDNLMQFLLSRD